MAEENPQQPTKWEPIESWVGAYDNYPTGTCPRCGCDEIDWGEGEYNADYYMVPGTCPDCGFYMEEYSDAELIDIQGYDEEAQLVVKPWFLDE